MEQDILEQTYLFFKHILNEQGAENYEGSGTYKTKNLRYHILGFLIDYKGFNGFPPVLEDKKFKKLDGKSWYHGFGHSEFGRDFLDSFNYHYGSGKYVDGFYLTDIETEAFKYVQDRLMMEDEKLDYSDISVKTQRNLTAEFKLVDARGIKEEKLEEYIKKFKNFNEQTIDDEDVRQKMMQIRNFLESKRGEKGVILFGDLMTEQNKSALAVYLGYDYIIDEVGYLVLLNRTKLAAKKSDLEKFSKGSKNESVPSESGMQ